MHDVHHNANSKRGDGRKWLRLAATSSDGERAPIASFWVRIMTSCISIKFQYKVYTLVNVCTIRTQMFTMQLYSILANIHLTFVLQLKITVVMQCTFDTSLYTPGYQGRISQRSKIDHNCKSIVVAT